MKSATIIHGILVALGLSLLSVPLFAVSAVLFPHGLGIRIVLGFLAFCYLSRIILSAETRTGRFSLSLGAAVTLGVAVWLRLSIIDLSIIAAGLIWLARSLYSYSSLRETILDGAVTGLSVISAAWMVMLSGSFVLAIWTFFLVQALVVLIPGKGEKAQSSCSTNSRHGIDRFLQAKKTAEGALRTLALRNE